MKSLIDKVGARNLIAAVIVGLGVAGVVLVATGQFSDDAKRPSSVAETARPRRTPAASTPSPQSFPDAPADEASQGSAPYGGERSYRGSYDPYYDQYYGSEYDDDAAEAYYGYPYEDDADDGTYVPPPPEERGGSGTGGEPGQPGYPYGDGDGSGGTGGEGGPGGGGG
jgi:hypothetical protein